MDWGFAVQMILATLGAAFIVGGGVAYRRSARTSVQVIGASAVAAGVVMWAVVLMTLQVYTTGESPDPIVEKAGVSTTQEDMASR